MKRFPSDASPCMATNTDPGLTRRESYSTPLTLGSPLWARTSAPSSRCWKVIAGNYRPPRNALGAKPCGTRHFSENHQYQGHFATNPAAPYRHHLITGTAPMAYYRAQL